MSSIDVKGKKSLEKGTSQKFNIFMMNLMGLNLSYLMDFKR